MYKELQMITVLMRNALMLMIMHTNLVPFHFGIYVLCYITYRETVLMMYVKAACQFYCLLSYRYVLSVNPEMVAAFHRVQ